MQDGPDSRGAPTVPRYRQILSVLRERIVDGVYPVGGLLPTENELCGTFGVSRYTVREALRCLAEDGFVERRQGSGTHVVSADPGPAFIHSVASVEDLFELPAAARYQVLDVAEDAPEGAEAEFVGAERGGDWVRVDGVRRLGDLDTVLCHTRIFLPRSMAHICETLGERPGPVGPAVEEQSGATIAEVMQHIRVEPMPRIAAASLDADEGALSVRMARRYVDAMGRTLVAVFNWHRLETFDQAVRLRRLRR